MIISPSPTREEALKKLEEFVPMASRVYNDTQMFDLGPSDRGNVSNLSFYLSNRLITDSEVASALLLNHKPKDIEIFLSELLRRSYWKGWLEGRPQVYSSWMRLRSEDRVRWPERAEYQSAIAGKTGIEVFDTWVSELLETGYLHHQARLNFASIWIFTLKLPWSLGADFFLRHLLDGDVASNTLSWRWVAGLQAKGKHFVAKAANVRAFTKGRLDPGSQLIEGPRALSGAPDPIYQVPVNFPFRVSSQIGEDYAVLLTGDDLSSESGYLGELKPKLVLVLDSQEISQKLEFSKKVNDAKSLAMKDAVERARKHFGCEVEVLSLGDEPCAALQRAAKKWEFSSLAYNEPFVGPWKEQTVAMTSKDVGLKFFPLRRPWDGLLHPYSLKSYVHFKKHALPQVVRAKGRFQKST